MIPPEFRTVNQTRIQSYIEESNVLLKSSASIRVADLVSIRTAFVQFYADAMRVMGGLDVVRQGTLAYLVQDLSYRIEGLASELQQITNTSLARHYQLARDLESAFLTNFLSSGGGSIISFAGLQPELLLVASGYSAQLIGLSQGGLTGRMLKRVNDVLRLGALGAAPDAFSSAKLVNYALGGPIRWTYEAERIYTTEVLRIHAMTLQASGESMNELVPTDKVWKWSGIKRKEHARINGQRIPMNARFRVPLREGGSVMMKHPRDPAAAYRPSAAINCGCTMLFIPREASSAAA